MFIPSLFVFPSLTYTSAFPFTGLLIGFISSFGVGGLDNELSPKIVQKIYILGKHKFLRNQQHTYLHYFLYETD